MVGGRSASSSGPERLRVMGEKQIFFTCCVCESWKYHRHDIFKLFACLFCWLKLSVKVAARMEDSVLDPIAVLVSTASLALSAKEVKQI